MLYCICWPQSNFLSCVSLYQSTGRPYFLLLLKSVEPLDQPNTSPDFLWSTFFFIWREGRCDLLHWWWTNQSQAIKQMAQRSVISEMDPDSYKCATVAESEGEREIRNEKERAKSICRRWGTTRKVGMRSTVRTNTSYSNAPTFFPVERTTLQKVWSRLTPYQSVAHASNAAIL